MRAALRAALVVMAAGAALALPPARPALACECLSVPSAREALDDSTSVFVGRAARVTPPRPRLRRTGSFPFVAYRQEPYDTFVVTLDVQGVWRGPALRQITVRTGEPYASCGIAFREGETYLVYAFANSAGQLMTYSCRRTAPLDRAAADVAALGPASPPTADGPGEPPPAEATAAACALTLALALAAGGWAARRSRRAARTTPGSPDRS